MSKTVGCKRRALDGAVVAVSALVIRISAERVISGEAIRRRSGNRRNGETHLADYSRLTPEKRCFNLHRVRFSPHIIVAGVLLAVLLTLQDDARAQIRTRISTSFYPLAVGNHKDSVFAGNTYFIITVRSTAFLSMKFERRAHTPRSGTPAMRPRELTSAGWSQAAHNECGELYS